MFFIALCIVCSVLPTSTFFLFSFLLNTAFQKHVFRSVNLSMLCWFSRLSSEVADSCIYLSSIQYLSRIFIWTIRFSLILAEITHPVKVLTVFQKDKKIYYSAGFYKSRTILPFSLTFSIRPENISTCVWVIFFKLNFKKAELFDERAMGFDANYFATFLFAATTAKLLLPLLNATSCCWGRKRLAPHEGKGNRGGMEFNCQQRWTRAAEQKSVRLNISWPAET